MSKANEYAKAMSGAKGKQPPNLVLDSKIVAVVGEYGDLELRKQYFDVREAVILARWILVNYTDKE